MHINQEYDTEEPNPWSWAVWVNKKTTVALFNLFFNSNIKINLRLAFNGKKTF